MEAGCERDHCGSHGHHCDHERQSGLAPLRSAYMPSRIPPSGRTTKPAPNVAVVSISAAYSLSLGKNCFAMMIERKPNTTKSYHSSTLPIVAATAPRQLPP